MEKEVFLAIATLLIVVVEEGGEVGLGAEGFGGDASVAHGLGAFETDAKIPHVVDDRVIGVVCALGGIAAEEFLHGVGIGLGQSITPW
jgi:hypothetical protein